MVLILLPFLIGSFAIIMNRTNEVPYGCFSNFYASPLVLDGKEWPTSEHWFQARSLFHSIMIERAYLVIVSPLIEI